MINKEKQREIETLLSKELISYFGSDEVKNILSMSKESGHVLANPVDEKCFNVLKENGFSVEKPVNPKTGKEMDRAHEDLQMYIGDFVSTCNYAVNDGLGYHRINSKFGEDKDGQPNVCAMNRLLKGVHDGSIDSYYLLKVMLVDGKPKVYFFDVFDCLEKNLLTYNSGPGQVMLKEKQLKEYSSEDLRQSKLTLKEKFNLLVDLYEKGMKEHIALRQKQLDEGIKKFRPILY